MKLLFVWSGLNGYMGGCWRELARRKGVELRVAVDVGHTFFGGMYRAEDVLRGLDWSGDLSRLTREDQAGDWRPDVVFAVGWRNRMCRAAAEAFPGAKKVCCFDMPWEWRLRKFAARFVLWRYLRRFDAAFVNGRAAARYAKWLGFRKDCIFTGSVGTDTRRFGRRLGGGGFLYVGRRSPEKGVDVLEKAYAMYRNLGGSWNLEVVCGVSPDCIAPYYERADCFVLPSRRDAWGVVLVEAAAAGLPIICTDGCGARFDVVGGNGLVVKAGGAGELAAAMAAVAAMSPEARRDMGGMGRELARPYSCEAWADRVVALSNGLVGGGER